MHINLVLFLGDAFREDALLDLQHVVKGVRVIVVDLPEAEVEELRGVHLPTGRGLPKKAPSTRRRWG
jgi:hypothetical protein